MESLLTTALIMCLSGDARCWIDDSQEVHRVEICGIAPEHAGARPTRIAGQLRGQEYLITVEAACESA